MNDYYCFIDESGQYELTYKNEPYYVKACILLSSNSYNKLIERRKEEFHKFEIEIDSELKWMHLWQLYNRDLLKRKIIFENEYEYLNNLSFLEASTIIENTFSYLSEVDSKIITTITPNKGFNDKVSKSNIEKFHYQNITQRIEFEMSEKNSNAIIVSDKLGDSELEKLIEENYSKNYKFGDLVIYGKIHDSIYFKDSKLNIGIQTADYVAGTINGFLNKRNTSTIFFKKYLSKLIRKDKRSNNPLGYGIIAIPRRDYIVEQLVNKFSLNTTLS